VLPGLLVFTVWVNLFFILVCGGSGEAGGGGGWEGGREVVTATNRTKLTSTQLMSCSHACSTTSYGSRLLGVHRLGLHDSVPGLCQQTPNTVGVLVAAVRARVIGTASRYNI
jgi:hypothetical protein